jgi:hypothetical protein
MVAGFTPTGRVLRLTLFADLEVKPRFPLSSATTDAADNIASFNPFSSSFEQ